MGTIPVIDIFAGPGGLGEGFSTCPNGGRRAFRIALSIEKEPSAHETLELRAFFRQFDPGSAPETYYQHVRGTFPRQDLYDRHPREAAAARAEAWLHELAEVTSIRVRDRIASALSRKEPWVLIGGPPCQAYSIAGRSRNMGIATYDAASDKRQTLYVEYLQILADHGPAVFVMENVKGLLSATHQSSRMFDRIREDLEHPARALSREGRRTSPSTGNFRYRLYPLSGEAPSSLFPESAAFVLRAEDYGVPQARHRIIVVGIRSDINRAPPPLRDHGRKVTAGAALKGLPRLRSGLSRTPDSAEAWLDTIRKARNADWMAWLRTQGSRPAYDHIRDLLPGLTIPRSGRGESFVPGHGGHTELRFESDWYLDERIGGTLNHSTRGHIAADLHRYLYASAYGKVEEKSPELADFPPELLPAHANVRKAIAGGYFADRFRVQLAGRPSTTITSHISKDGHYYIHPDPSQCRSLTVREAARLQTFPDNYFFCRQRTAQYTQVGNAVPPLLARQIAAIVRDLLK